ncbi:glycosyltransferase [Clostridium sp. YIM B02555]|uniref:glycosyltransferase n=1 Tax=Clostridium sp. YIM B02555 TaxID=2911968 RepID=UPI001EEE7431
MNICIVSRELYPFQKSGIGVYVYSLIKNLCKTNNVYLITEMREEDIDFVFESNNVRVFMANCNEYIEMNLFNNFNSAYSYAVYNKIIEINDTEVIDIIEFADYFGEGFFTILNKKIFRSLNEVPIVLKLHTPSLECSIFNDDKNIDYDVTSQEDFCIENSDYVYAISHAMKDIVGKRLDIKDVEVVYNFTGVNEVEKVNEVLKNERKTILYVGRIEKRKGVDLLINSAIEILKKYQDVEFILIGKDTSYSDSNSSMVEHLKGFIPDEIKERVKFIKPMDREKLQKYYASAYVSVFPSIWEGFGNVCIEAMSCGSPVIVSDSGGMMEIINNGEFGLSFESGNIIDLSRKLELIIKNLNKREKLKEKSLERAKFFSDSKIYNDQMKFYNKVIIDYKRENVNSKLEEGSTNFIFKNWLNGIKYQQQYYDEIKRVTKEWNREVELCKTLKIELNRVLLEWEKEVKNNRLLRSELIDKDTEISKKSEELQFEIKENEELIKKNEELIKKNEELIKENQFLKECINNKKWLLKKLVSKGDKQ